MEYQVVFVSPLLRTLQTAIYLFGTHPHRDRIKYSFISFFEADFKLIYLYPFNRFIVMPEIYECLCSSGCFAPDTLTNIKPKMISFAE